MHPVAKVSFLAPGLLAALGLLAPPLSAAPVTSPPLEAWLTSAEGASVHVQLVGGDREKLRYEEISTPGTVRETPLKDLHGLSLVEPAACREALSLYESRRYRAAREKFAVVQRTYADYGFLQDNPATLAAFGTLECLRQEGDLEALARAAAAFDKSRLSREYQQRQFDLYAMWEALRTQSWDRLIPICQERLGQRLPGGQRAQAAYCLGAALEAKGKPEEALAAYHEAMAAAAGEADVSIRQAAVHAMRLYRKMPDAAAALARKETASPALRELLSLVRAYPLHFAAGEPLPEDLKDLPVLAAAPVPVTPEKPPEKAAGK